MADEDAIEPPAHIIEKQVLFVSDSGNGVKYRVLKRLGAGSFGWVCAAERVSDGLKVALKFPREHDVDKFGDEINVCRDLSDCINITRCLDVTRPVHPTLQFAGMVLELCHIDMEQFIDSPWYGRLTANIITVILNHIWHGAAHVHRKGYNHRDFTLRNFMIDASTGTMKVGDFGIAIRAEEELDLKCEVTQLARVMSHATSGTRTWDHDPRVEQCTRALYKDPECDDFTATTIGETLNYVFQTDCCYWYNELMDGNKKWWDERVAQAPETQIVAEKAVQWMHMHPEPGHVPLPLDLATTYVRSFGFRGYDAIDAAGIASDIGQLTTSAMRVECRAFFQEFLRQQSGTPQDPPSIRPVHLAVGVLGDGAAKAQPAICAKCRARRSRRKTFRNLRRA